MALIVDDQLRALLQDGTKKPQLILEIDGLPSISSIPVGKYAIYGDPIVYGMSGLVYGGLIDDETILPYIDVQNSTQQITQQLLIDKGGFSSATSFDVKIVDKDQEITNMITPGNIVDDVVSRKARLYLSLEGAGHPRDSVMFFAGVVAGVKAGAGFVNINLASPEKLKNLEIFPKVSTELTSNINSSVTTIPVTSTSDFMLPADSGTLRTYIQIQDEIIEYTGISGNSFTGCVRGQFGTIAVSHSINENVESAYRLIGNLKDLSLKLMLSGVNESYAEDIPILAIENFALQSIPNTIFVSKEKFDEFYGTVAGDSLTISGDAHPANNGTFIVQSIIQTDLGSQILVDGPLVLSTDGAVISLKSKYAVLPKFAGLEMTPDQVDVPEFENKYVQYGANFFEYDFYIKEAVNGSEFINTQILYPSGCYAIPRKAKTSMGTTTPPLAQLETKKLDETNVIDAGSLVIDRNISNNFYNAVIIKYDKDQVEDKFKRGKITQSSSSTSRIKVANKPLVIESNGVRSDAGFEYKFAIQSRRYLERYQYAAESIVVKTDYGTGFDIEIGDVVILSAKNLKVSDTSSGNGTRDFSPRLFEVQNKVLNITGKPISLTLVDTAYNLNGRYGVISPSSVVDVGSSTTQVKLKKSFGTLLGTKTEGYKWRNFDGQLIRIRSEDYSFDEERTLVQIDPANDNALIVDPALPSAPLENYIIDIIKYPTSTSAEDGAIYKNMFVYWNNQIDVVTGISQTQFTVSTPHLSDIKVGYQVKIHNDLYTYQSELRYVTDITGNTVTVDGALGFTPNPSDRVELLGWNDGGKPYLWL